MFINNPYTKVILNFFFNNSKSFEWVIIWKTGWIRQPVLISLLLVIPIEKLPSPSTNPVTNQGCNLSFGLELKKRLYIANVPTRCKVENNREYTILTWYPNLFADFFKRIEKLPSPSVNPVTNQGCSFPFILELKKRL